MELWIRSQDRTTLIRSYEIYISEYGKDSYVIKAKRTSHILGSYNTFERALEVLDEIQKLFEPKIILKSIKEIAQTLDGVYYTTPNEYEIEQLSSYVYQMPEE